MIINSLNSVYHRNPNKNNKLNTIWQKPVTSFTSRSKNYNVICPKSDLSSVYPRRYLPDDYPNENSFRTYDSFTGLRDKNYLLTTIGALMESPLNDRISIAMFDMDNFKSVNELLGYKTGDDFIKRISNKISSAAKNNSLSAYRFGGEEFVIVFDNQSQDEQQNIAEKIVSSIKNDDYIRSKSRMYIENARYQLKTYEKMQDKVKDLIPLKAERDLLEDLRENLSSDKAKRDPYLIKSLLTVNNKIKNNYLILLSEQLALDDVDKDTKDILVDNYVKLKHGTKLTVDEEKELDEYLLSVYDKTFEIHQLKKWINDFIRNQGFSITGAIATFNRDTLKNKLPIDVINETGEVLKQGKSTQKGKEYYKII